MWGKGPAQIRAGNGGPYRFNGNIKTEWRDCADIDC